MTSVKKSFNYIYIYWTITIFAINNIKFKKIQFIEHKSYLRLLLVKSS